MVPVRATLSADPVGLLKKLINGKPQVHDAAYSKKVIAEEAQYVLQVRLDCGACRPVLFTAADLLPRQANPIQDNS